MILYNLSIKKKKCWMTFSDKLKDKKCIALACCKVKIIFGGIYKTLGSHLIAVLS